MPVTYVSGTTARRVGSTWSFSYNAGTAANRILIVSLTTQTTGHSCTFGGQSLTNGYQITSGVLGGQLYNFYKTGPASGTQTLVVGIPSYQDHYMGVSTFAGAAAEAPTSYSTSYSGTTSNVATGTSTTCPTDGMLVGFAMTNYTTSGSYSGGTGTTLISSIRDGASGRGVANGYRATTGSININLPSNSSSRWVLTMALAAYVDPTNPSLFKSNSSANTLSAM